MEWLTKELFAVYGPLALGWILFLWERLKREKDLLTWKQLFEAYHTDHVETLRVLDSVQFKIEASSRAEESLANAIKESLTRRAGR